MDWRDKKYVGWTAQVIMCELKDDNVGSDAIKIKKAIQRLALLKDTLKNNKYKESKAYLDWKKFVDLERYPFLDEES